jgi:hypothetical protein
MKKLKFLTSTVVLVGMLSACSTSVQSTCKSDFEGVKVPEELRLIEDKLETYGCEIPSTYHYVINVPDEIINEFNESSKLVKINSNRLSLNFDGGFFMLDTEPGSTLTNKFSYSPVDKYYSLRTTLTNGMEVQLMESEEYLTLATEDGIFIDGEGSPLSDEEFELLMSEFVMLKTLINNVFTSISVAEDDLISLHKILENKVN